MKSELVELQIIDSNGSQQRYYTYDGYYDEQDRYTFRKIKNRVEKRTFTSSAITGMLAFYVSKKMQMPSFSFKQKMIPIKGLVSGALAFGVGYLFFDFIGTNQLANLQKNIALNSKHLPLWKQKRLAVNPDRAFFELVDSKDNQICIFHSGLTPEAAARILPDKIIGTIPEKPQKPHSEHHEQH